MGDLLGPSGLLKASLTEPNRQQMQQNVECYVIRKKLSAHRVSKPSIFLLIFSPPTLPPFFFFLSSVFCHLSSVICHLSSVVLPCRVKHVQHPQKHLIGGVIFSRNMLLQIFSAVPAAFQWWLDQWIAWLSWYKPTYGAVTLTAAGNWHIPWHRFWEPVSTAGS
jgi:hypothetical protein